MIAAGSMAAHATPYNTSWNSGFLNGGLVLDNNPNGWSDTRTISTAGAINDISVTLELSGGWNGDLYAYLVHDSGFTVLLDRVGTGVSGVSSYGYGDAGMNVTLAASGDSLHHYGGNNTFSSVPTGTYMVDNTSGSLGSFVNISSEGTWSLFIADDSAGGVSTVQSWGLQMDITAMPEPQTWILMTGTLGAFLVKRQTRQKGSKVLL